MKYCNNKPVIKPSHNLCVDDVSLKFNKAIGYIEKKDRIILIWSNK